MSAKRVYFDTLRSLAFGDISGTYAAVGDPLSVEARTICITNQTDGDMIFSDDDTISEGQIFVPANCFRLYDLTANLVPQKDDSFVIAKSTQFYVKESSAPTSGAVYIEVVYAGVR